MAQLGQSRIFTVSMMGKIKTIRPMVAIPFPALRRHLDFGILDTRIAGRIFIWAAAVLVLWSDGVLPKAAFQGRKSGKQDRNFDQKVLRGACPVYRLNVCPNRPAVADDQ